MQLFSALACFSPSVPSGVKDLWGRNGGKIARSAREKRYSSYYFCNGLSDPWLPELSINGSRVVFHATWVRNSVDAGYRLSLARYVLDDRFEILNRPKAASRHASTPIHSSLSLSSSPDEPSEPVDTTPTPRLYASKRRLPHSPTDSASESKRLKLSVADILTLTPRPVSPSDATPSSMSETFSSQEVRAALIPSNAQESTPPVQSRSTHPSMLPTRSSPVHVKKEPQSNAMKFKSIQSVPMSLQSSHLSAVPSKVSSEPSVVSTETREDILHVHFSDSSDSKEQERRYVRPKAKRHSLPSNFWASVAHPSTGSTTSLMTISIDKMLALPQGLEQELDFFKPGTAYKGKEFRAVECRRRRTV